MQYKGKRYSVYSLASTKALTQPSSPSRPVHGNHFNPPGDIPEQLAAYSAHALSTALFMLDTHFALKQYGINCLAQGQTKVPRQGIKPASPTPNQLSYCVPVYQQLPAIAHRGAIYTWRYDFFHKLARSHWPHDYIYRSGMCMTQLREIIN